MYSLTHSAFYLGLVGLVQFLPMLVLSLFVGHLSDTYDRIKIISISQIIESVFILFLAYTSYSGWLTKERFLYIIFFIAVAHSFQGPPMQALLPNIVSIEIFPRASALMSSVSEFAVILGAISLDLFGVLFGGATALLPIYASTILNIGSFGLGILRSAPAVGALLMSAYLAKKTLKKMLGILCLLQLYVLGYLP